jgi:hypothetical protein
VGSRKADRRFTAHRWIGVGSAVHDERAKGSQAWAYGTVSLDCQAGNHEALNRGVHLELRETQLPREHRIGDLRALQCHEF